MQLIKGFFDGLRPVRKVTVSEWADTNRYLTSESAAEPGLWRTTRTPYLKEIMDAMSPTSLTKEVIVIKGVQLGFTEAALNIVGCYIDLSPTPIMYVMPTVEMSRAISEGRIDPMVEHSEVLKLKVRPARERDSGNTKLVKKFPGGILVLSGANSAASLRSRPVRVLILDELDAYPLNIDNEGSPVGLAEKRTSTFGSRKKVFKLSTPTIDGASIIDREFQSTDQRKFYVPCPHCDEMQELIWENLIWEKGHPETAKYGCPHCGGIIEERSKNNMLLKGEWRSTVPEKRCDERIGFHLNSLYSPLGWKSWADIADEWEKAQDDTNLLRVFINTILGETWKEQGDAPEWTGIHDRREDYAQNKPKKSVVFITGGADVQKDRIEVEIVGWCRKKVSYSIDYRVIMGDTSAKAVWNKLDEIVNESWTREDGVILPMKLMAVDSGYNTTEVYEFCRRFDASRVIPVKGQDKQAVIISAPKYVDVSKNKKKGKLRLFNIGLNILKSELYGWLRLRIEDGVEPAGYCHFPQYGEDHFKGLTAEELTFHIKNGYRMYYWKKKYARNEQLDCRNYARAAASVVGMDRFNDGHWNNMDSNQVGAKKPASTKKKKKESTFWKK